MPKIWVLVIVAGLVMAVLPAGAALDPGAEKAVRDYLTALSRNDRETMKRLTPSAPRDFYGPFIFTSLPTLSNPRVDSHRAAVDFEGETIDPDLGMKGTITLVKLDERTKDAWQVRQLLWYDKNQLPLSVRLPDKSVSRQDARQEDDVLGAARDYLLAWQQADYERMQYLTFDWLSRKKQKPPRFVKLRELRFQEGGELEGALKVKYRARLTLLGFISRWTSGFVYALKEGESWKVRGNNASF